MMIEAMRSSETSVLQKPHGVTSKKMILFIVTAVKTSNHPSFDIFPLLEKPIMSISGPVYFPSGKKPNGNKDILRLA
jgi:hypothetical protein